MFCKQWRSRKLRVNRFRNIVCFFESPPAEFFMMMACQPRESRSGESPKEFLWRLSLGLSANPFCARLYLCIQTIDLIGLHMCMAVCIVHAHVGPTAPTQPPIYPAWAGNVLFPIVSIVRSWNNDRSADSTKYDRLANFLRTCSFALLIFVHDVQNSAR
jgi:hypothetical protein